MEFSSENGKNPIKKNFKKFFPDSFAVPHFFSYL